MAQLPLQIRKDIRDVFTNDTSPVQKAFKKLAEIVGYAVSCEVEWQMLWNELEPVYPDTATFVPSICSVAEVWSDSLASRIEDDRFEEWSEEFLGRLTSVSKIELFIQTSDATTAETRWLETKRAFIISLPNKSVSRGINAASGFATNFENLFNRDKHVGRTNTASVEMREDDDWADLESLPDTRSASVNIRTREPDPVEEKPKALPSLQTLARPDILFPTLTPYLMHVSSSGGSKVTVTGSHEPCLRLLAEYLQRWIKQNLQDVRKALLTFPSVPLLRIKLNESSFGLGLLHDSVTIEPFDHHQRHAGVNVILILAFIQGVLGYQLIAETSGAGYWEFTRVLGFPG